jgi:hypothetical protein
MRCIGGTASLAALPNRRVGDSFNGKRYAILH